MLSYLLNVVPAYASLANKRRIQSIHAFIIKRGLDLYGYVVLGTAMVGMDMGSV